MSDNIQVNCQTAIVNGENVALFKRPSYKTGGPAVNVLPALMGNSVKSIHKRNYADAVSEVTLTFHNTEAAIDRSKQWQRKIGTNSIRLVDEDTGHIETFEKMSVTESPKYDFDGDSFELTFKGDPAQ